MRGTRITLLLLLFTFTGCTATLRSETTWQRSIHDAPWHDREWAWLATQPQFDRLNTAASAPTPGGHDPIWFVRIIDCRWGGLTAIIYFKPHTQSPGYARGWSRPFAAPAFELHERSRDPDSVAAALYGPADTWSPIADCFEYEYVGPGPTILGQVAAPGTVKLPFPAQATFDQPHELVAFVTALRHRRQWIGGEQYELGPIQSIQRVSPQMYRVQTGVQRGPLSGRGWVHRVRWADGRLHHLNTSPWISAAPHPAATVSSTLARVNSR